MMNNRLYSILLTAMVAAIAFSAPAMGDPTEGADYTACPAITTGIAQPSAGFTLNTVQGSVFASAVEESICPHATKVHVKKVCNYTKTLNVDLKWSNPNASLKLIVYSPNGIQFGPWDDSSDGVLDHEINMDISNPDIIETGQWHYVVIYDKGVEKTDYII
jgi:hypothetical protein